MKSPYNDISPHYFESPFSGGYGFEQKHVSFVLISRVITKGRNKRYLSTIVKQMDEKRKNFLHIIYGNKVSGGVKMRMCELREKEVVNICSGKCLGKIVDIDIKACSGEVEAIIVPGPGKLCGVFGTDSEYIIPFSCITKIGPDLILVEIKEEKCLQKY